MLRHLLGSDAAKGKELKILIAAGVVGLILFIGNPTVVSVAEKYIPMFTTKSTEISSNEKLLADKVKDFQVANLQLEKTLLELKHDNIQLQADNKVCTESINKLHDDLSDLTNHLQQSDKAFELLLGRCRAP